jgi:hypothetical protein
MNVTYEEGQFATRFLPDVKEFVADQFSIDDVYSSKQIEGWLADNADDFGYISQDDIEDWLDKHAAEYGYMRGA